MAQAPSHQSLHLNSVVELWLSFPSCLKFASPVSSCLLLGDGSRPIIVYVISCHIWENKRPLSSFFLGYLRYQGFDHHFSAEICCSFPLPRNPRVQVFLLYLEPRSSSAEAKMEGMQWDNDQEYSIRLVLKKQKRSKHWLKQDWYSYI